MINSNNGDQPHHNILCDDDQNQRQVMRTHTFQEEIFPDDPFDLMLDHQWQSYPCSNQDMIDMTIDYQTKNQIQLSAEEDIENIIKH